jgi:hypothetical protein
MGVAKPPSSPLVSVPENRALLGKWFFKPLTEDMILQTLLKRKYIDSSALSKVCWKLGVSHFWANIMATKNLFFSYGSFVIKMAQ